MGSKFFNKSFDTSKFSSTCLYSFAALLALTSMPVFSQVTVESNVQQNTVIAKATPSTAVKSGKTVNKEVNKKILLKSSTGKTKSGVKSGAQAGAKSKIPASSTAQGGTNTAQTKPASPLSSTSAPVITYLSQDAKEWIRGGEMVHITMQGTPGGAAAFRVIGLTESIGMQEAASGRYIGTWTVPVGKPLPMTRAMIAGDLNLNGKSAVTMQAARPLCVDTVAPLIQNVAPISQATVTTAMPTLSADISDEGSGIDLGATHLIINGRDLSGEAIIASDHITYKPANALTSGDQTVQLIITDRAGNTTTQTWHFTVNANSAK